MGAPNKLARKPGTGSVRRHRWGQSKWIARLPPEPGEKHGKIIGRFDTQFRAHQALDAWVAEMAGRRAS